jgi:hypothetical protein
MPPADTRESRLRHARATGPGTGLGRRRHRAAGAAARRDSGCGAAGAYSSAACTAERITLMPAAWNSESNAALRLRPVMQDGCGRGDDSRPGQAAGGRPARRAAAGDVTVASRGARTGLGERGSELGAHLSRTSSASTGGPAANGARRVAAGGRAGATGSGLAGCVVTGSCPVWLALRYEWPRRPGSGLGGLWASDAAG